MVVSPTLARLLCPLVSAHLIAGGLHQRSEGSTYSSCGGVVVMVVLWLKGGGNGGVVVVIVVVMVVVAVMGEWW